MPTGEMTSEIMGTLSLNVISTLKNDSTVVAKNNIPLFTLPELFLWIPQLIILTAAIVVSICGNGFTIYAFVRFGDLRTPFNAYIINLAVSDICMSSFVIPLYLITICYGYWPFGETFCWVWIFMDWFMTFESVLTLAVISIERFWSIRWPISYRQGMRPQSVAMTIPATWGIVFCIWTPGFFHDRYYHTNDVLKCFWDPAQNYTSGLYIGVLSYIIPFCLMVASYTYIGLKMRNRLKTLVLKLNRSPEVFVVEKTATPDLVEVPSGGTLSSANISRQNSNNKTASGNNKFLLATSRERSNLVTLGVIVIAFTICWIPFYVFFFLSIAYRHSLSDWSDALTSSLAYLNCAANPVLNTVFNPEFRRKFLEILRQ